MLRERYPDLNEEEDVRQDAIIEDHWRDVDKGGDSKKRVHSLRW